MNTQYNPKEYWENRLSNCFSLRGVGHFAFSESYNSWLYLRKRRCIGSFFKNTSLKGKDILDVGCGTGFFIEWYLQRGANVCGMDITEASIKKLKQQYKCEFIVQDITSREYRPPRKFDIVNMWDVSYHIVDPGAFERAFDNIASSLKEEGLLLFTDWFGADSDLSQGAHVQARCLDTYQQVLTRKGFELVTVRPLYKMFCKHHCSLDNRLGWFYFFVDTFSGKISRDNLSLSVWRYTRKNT
jgi:SAM-dependent methyltransferase